MDDVHTDQKENDTKWYQYLLMYFADGCIRCVMYIYMYWFCVDMQRQVYIYWYVKIVQAYRRFTIICECSGYEM
jgi:hypothetical protein